MLRTTHSSVLKLLWHVLHLLHLNYGTMLLADLQFVAFDNTKFKNLNPPHSQSLAINFPIKVYLNLVFSIFLICQDGKSQHTKCQNIKNQPSQFKDFRLQCVYYCTQSTEKILTNWCFGNINMYLVLNESLESLSISKWNIIRHPFVPSCFNRKKPPILWQEIFVFSFNIKYQYVWVIVL